jgi:hypothetical protein
MWWPATSGQSTSPVIDQPPGVAVAEMIPASSEVCRVIAAAPCSNSQRYYSPGWRKTVHQFLNGLACLPINDWRFRTLVIRGCPACQANNQRSPGQKKQKQIAHEFPFGDAITGRRCGAAKATTTNVERTRSASIFRNECLVRSLVQSNSFGLGNFLNGTALAQQPGKHQ